MLVRHFRTRGLLLWVLALTVASLLTEISVHVFGHGRLYGLIPLLDMGSEENLPTWFNTLLLLGCATLTLVIGSIRKHQQGQYGWHWLGLSAALLVLSIDEAAAVHEKVDTVIGEQVERSGVLFFPWVVIGMVAVVAFGIAYRPFLRSLPLVLRRQLLAAFALYVGGALVLDVVEGVYLEAYGDDLVVGGIVTLQDAMEMTGVVFALGAFAQYLRWAFPHLHLRIPDATLEANSAEPLRSSQVAPKPSGAGVRAGSALEARDLHRRD